MLPPKLKSKQATTTQGKPQTKPKERQKALYRNEGTYYKGDIEYKNQHAASLKLKSNGTGIDYEIINRFHIREAAFQVKCASPGGTKLDREGKKHQLKPGASASGTIDNADQNGHSKLFIDGTAAYEYKHTKN
ncbi:hypothetical protein MUCCIDRAFT_157397 [Mucor lusitanicus CBS 277.49]|uniref:Uncharacterized protein n=1 Tax=Mucor lusitanicus CBS 277.49 TaxID=747725 RepID=A0A168H5X2_MUCCL|nr:hypothetical protein MUCCIDRAFT_157397 [Mucor lusitanicus CBS 277.49]